MNIIISCLAILWWLILIPVGLGMLFHLFSDRAKEGTLGSMAYGYVVMFAVFEMISVPMILTQQSFHLMVWIVAMVMSVGAVASLYLNRKYLPEMIFQGARGTVSQPWTVYLALALIILQIAVYLIFMSTDLDDAFYVAAASTAMEKDAMYTYSAYGGYALGYVPSRYGLSPFPMLLAFLSQCIQLNPATVAHTVLPLFLVSFAYIVYDRLGALLFRGERKQIGMFLAFISLIHMSSYYSVYTQGTFLLIRIWQGKAVLAGVLLPFLFRNCYKVLRAKPEKGDWLLLFLNVTACCMVSSMGVALTPVMLAVMGIVFALLEKKWKNVCFMMLCGLPCVILGVCYLMIR
ncbi:MAG: DUF6077 domain-containing protein [Eubacteriales bacterium]|nr:DUF6077 domain-containing protein [Eubacteriales bacterium]